MESFCLEHKARVAERTGTGVKWRKSTPCDRRRYGVEYQINDSRQTTQGWKRA